MRLLARLRKRRQTPQFEAYHPIWGGWNYPKPIETSDDSSRHPGQDSYLKDLVYMAEHGWYYCQRAIVEMDSIHPATDYRPVISAEFRRTFTVLADSRPKTLLDPITLTLYERAGKLIMANDWEAYWMYRERQDITAYCIIIGHFNSHPSIAVLDRPFMIARPMNQLHNLKNLT